MATPGPVSPCWKRGTRMGEAGQAVAGWSATAAGIAILAIAVSVTALLLLHVLSPEYAWSWRMVSEYANGRFPWVLTVVFLAWAAGSFAVIWALYPRFETGFAGNIVPSGRVRVFDDDGHPIHGVQVHFSVEGGGEIAWPSSFTDDDGYASAGRWRLGP